MNSLRRRRERPRKRSVNFRSFAYVLVREAFVEEFGEGPAKLPGSNLRYKLAALGEGAVRSRFKLWVRQQRRAS